MITSAKCSYGLDESLAEAFWKFKENENRCLHRKKKKKETLLSIHQAPDTMPKESHKPDLTYFPICPQIIPIRKVFFPFSLGS